MNEINIDDYQPLIHLIINRFDKQYRKELFNESYIKLFEIKKKYIPTKGTFESYAFKHLYYHCKHYIKLNNLNHSSLDELAYDEDNEETRKVDLLESTVNLESSIETKDYIQKHSKQLTQIEKFIQQKYYQSGVSVKNIIKVYQPFHLIKSEKTIRKILKK
ncbi:sigma-70 family RNA polymerase sigma factor [Mariniflexile gromovii]|uniref:Sigma-70 family RNA polymerase sigma factor n=1 Tax=Mariniflexile gromovii TaxID=362523 RepID=A0ABS4BXU6_9FLAO|nr:sigma-70 family RNA polymerase sigma factor [Mariniflexile gromovii]MBP0904857.1 sigma-70 family RNA polymerase sigma factor [Mariniflexile gromovii]